MLIVDAGSSCLPVDQSTKSLIPIFLAHVPQKINLAQITIVVSHPDKDHLNWLKHILVHDAIKQNKNITVYLGGNFEKYLTPTKTKIHDARALLNELVSSSSIKIHSLSHVLTIDDMRALAKKADECSEQYKKDHAPGYEDLDSAVIQTLRIRSSPLHRVRPFIVRSNIDGLDDCNRVRVEILGANAGHAPTRIYPIEGSGVQSFINDTRCPEGEVVNPDENTNSIVLRVTFYSKGSIIITGDATGITTNRLVRHYLGSQDGTFNCNLLKACHHGSITEESNNPSWVKATQPKWIIFSAGMFDSYHHPQFDAVWNYAGSERLEIAQEHPVLCARVDTRILPNYDDAKIRGIVYTTQTHPDEK
jgi:beta-lactamase superfamily II metal-dependent hydrolase